MGGRVRPASVVVVLAVGAAAACGAGSGADTARGADGELTGEVLVSAAASLADAFADVEVAVEAAHPGVDVVLNLAGSATLREQVLQGAPVDVFASADTATMRALVAAGEVDGDPVVVATNRLQVAVPAGNPAGVTGLGDFADEALFLGLCAEGVPCGDLARRVLRAAGVTPAPDTTEPDVRALLTRVAEGELDAGITYVTDVLAAGDRVDGVGIPASVNASTEYPVAVLAGARNPAGAAAVVAFVRSEQGRALLVGRGFGVP